MELDDGNWRSNVLPDDIKVTEDGSSRGKLESDYFLLSLFALPLPSSGRRENNLKEEEEEEEEGEEREEGGYRGGVDEDASELMVKYNNKKSGAALTMSDYDPSNW